MHGTEQVACHIRIAIGVWPMMAWCLIAMTACSTTLGSRIAVPTTDQLLGSEDGCHLALAEGRLERDERWGVALVHDAGRCIVEWPVGYAAA